MKKVVLTKENKKDEKKVFTKKKGKDIIKKNCHPFKVNRKIYKRRDGLYMKDIELKETKFIDEESYQQIKKNMGKSNDYFTQEELEKIGVILA